MNNFYESGYVEPIRDRNGKIVRDENDNVIYRSKNPDKFLRDRDGQIVVDGQGNPIYEAVKSPLRATMEMLADNGYTRVGILIKDNFTLEGSDGIINELVGNELAGGLFSYQRANRKLIYKDCEFYFFFFDREKDVDRLRGPIFDAAIVTGAPSKDFIAYLDFTLRLGNNPIRIHIG